MALADQNNNNNKENEMDLEELAYDGSATPALLHVATSYPPLRILLKDPWFWLKAIVSSWSMKIGKQLDEMIPLVGEASSVISRQHHAMHMWYVLVCLVASSYQSTSSRMICVQSLSKGIWLWK